jgi:prepilin-type N-terminal cleavage/methylation domain-containing protein
MIGRRSCGGDERGWSLAELLVVLVVIAIITAVAMPLLLSYWQSATVRAGAQELRTALNAAKQLAITLRKPICLQPLGASAYQFHQVTCVGAVVPPAVAPGSDATGTFQLQNNVVLSVTAGSAAPVFSPLGGATVGQFTVTGLNGTALTVSVSGAGRITTP